MKAATRDWCAKAEGDFLAAKALARRRKVPLHDQVCFHCQQSAEKYLKARLEEAGIHYPKTKNCSNWCCLWNRCGLPFVRLSSRCRVSPWSSAIPVPPPSQQMRAKPCMMRKPSARKLASHSDCDRAAEEVT
jgi:hypothetical protein